MTRNDPILHSLSQTAISLLLDRPFFAHLLNTCCRELTQSATQSMDLVWKEGVWVLRVHPAYWKNLDPLQRQGILEHQLLHLLFDHPAEALTFSDGFLFDLAADLTINQYIEANKLPVGAIGIELFKDLALESRKGTAYYYEALQLLQADGGEIYPLAHTQLQRIFQERRELFDGHRSWHRALPGVEQQLMRRSVRAIFVPEILEEVGSLPAELQRQVAFLSGKVIKRPDWRRVLRLFAQSSRKTMMRETLHRPSKRYGSIPGVRVRRRQRLLLGLDTSGSVSGKLLGIFWKEMERIARTGAEIEVVEFDAGIQRIYPFSQNQPDWVKGGGGTDFVPLIEYANRRRAIDGLIVFTDGFAPTPLLPCRIPVFWLISDRGVGEGSPLYSALPGRKFKLAEPAE